jgi:hypothetical protein
MASDAFQAVEDFMADAAQDYTQVTENYAWYSPVVAEAKARLEVILEVRNHLAELEDVDSLDFEDVETQAAEIWAGA